jgi:hypothetical protein
VTLAVVSAKLRALPPPPVGFDQYKETTLFTLSLRREPRDVKRSGKHFCLSHLSLIRNPMNLEPFIVEKNLGE